MQEQGLASLEQLLAATKKRRYKLVTLPASGLKVRIQSLSELELQKYQADALAKMAGAGTLSKARLIDAQRRLFVLCIVDSEGRPVLNESHVESLGDWDGADGTALYQECAQHCGINARDVEDLAKNSERITVGD